MNCRPNNFQCILALPDSVIRVLIRKSYATHGQNISDTLNKVYNVVKSSCKGLVIHDEDDTDIPWHNGKEVVDAWSDASYIKTRGLGHRRIIHDEGVINDIVSFLDEADRALPFV